MMSSSKRTFPASIHSPQAFVIVWFVPARGAFGIYQVAASVVVTSALVAAKVGRAMAAPTQAAAVPDPAVALSVKVCAEKLSTDPVVAGVPVFAPLVKFHDTEAEDTTVVTAAASSVSVNPSKSTAAVSGEISVTGLLRIDENSVFKSDAVSTSPAIQFLPLRVPCYDLIQR